MPKTLNPTHLILQIQAGAVRGLKGLGAGEMNSQRLQRLARAVATYARSGGNALFDPTVGASRHASLLHRAAPLLSRTTNGRRGMA